MSEPDKSQRIPSHTHTYRLQTEIIPAKHKRINNASKEPIEKCLKQKRHIF